MKKDGTVTDDYDLLYEDDGKLQLYINDPQPNAKYELVISKDVEFVGEGLLAPKNDISYSFTLATAGVDKTVSVKENKTGNVVTSKTITVDARKYNSYYDGKMYVAIYANSGKQLKAISNKTAAITIGANENMTDYTAKIFIFTDELKPLLDNAIDVTIQ